MKSFVAGRLARNVLQTGKVLLNGKKRRLDFGAVVSYPPSFRMECFFIPSNLDRSRGWYQSKPLMSRFILYN